MAKWIVSHQDEHGEWWSLDGHYDGADEEEAIADYLRESGAEDDGRLRAEEVEED